ncbi:MAG: S49 family peptidase [Cytophagales bacterium]|nr:S49 family peptidase [Cytophagales bacterium]
MNKSDFRLIRSIVGGTWHIHQASAMGLMPLALQYMSGELKVENEISSETKELPSWAKRYLSGFNISGQKSEPYVSEADTWYYDEFPVRVGNVVVIPIIGAISQYDYCGAAGTKTIASWYKKADADPEVLGIIEFKNSPGGAALGTRALADLKTRITKPIIGFVEAMECSAAKYIGAADDYTFASSDECIIGSVGVMTNFSDWSEWYKQKGIKNLDLYSKASPLKNDSYRKAMGGDFSGYTDGLLFKLDQSFMSFMKNQMPGVSSEALEGADYLTQDAIQNGLCHAVGTFEDAYNMALTASKKDLSIFNSNQMSKKVTMEIPEGAVWAVKALGGKTVEAVKPEASTTETKEEPATEAPEATAEAPKTEAPAENPLQAEVTALKAQLSEKDQEVNSLKEGIKALSSNPAAQRTAARQEGNDPAPEKPEAEAEVKMTMADEYDVA